MRLRVALAAVAVTSIYAPRDTTRTYPILMMTRTPYGVVPYGPDRHPHARR